MQSALKCQSSNGIAYSNSHLSRSKTSLTGSVQACQFLVLKSWLPFESCCRRRVITLAVLARSFQPTCFRCLGAERMEAKLAPACSFCVTSIRRLIETRCVNKRPARNRTLYPRVRRHRICFPRSRFNVLFCFLAKKTRGSCSLQPRKRKTRFEWIIDDLDASHMQNTLLIFVCHCFYLCWYLAISIRTSSHFSACRTLERQLWKHLVAFFSFCVCVLLPLLERYVRIFYRIFSSVLCFDDADNHDASGIFLCSLFLPRQHSLYFLPRSPSLY